MKPYFINAPRHLQLSQHPLHQQFLALVLLRQLLVFPQGAQVVADGEDPVLDVVQAVRHVQLVVAQLAQLVRERER